MNDLWIDKIFQRAKQEFLRFSDIRGRSSQSQFWSYALFIAIVGIFYFLLSQPLLPLLSASLMRFGEAVIVAPLAVLVVPTFTAIVRRISDTIPARRFWASLINFRQRNQVQFVIFRIVILIALLAMFILASVYIPVVLVFAIVVLTLLPSDPVLQRTGPSASMATVSRTVPPPAPTSGDYRIQQQNVTSTVGAIRHSHKDAPKKSLLRRVWFWISVLGAVVLLLTIMFPGLFSQVGSGSEGHVERTNSDSPSKIRNEPTPSDAASSEPDQEEAVIETSEPQPTFTEQVDAANLDPRFKYCTHAIAAGYGPYVNGKDPEYSWYNDRDGDGIVCER